MRNYERRKKNQRPKKKKKNIKLMMSISMGMPNCAEFTEQFFTLSGRHANYKTQEDGQRLGNNGGATTQPQEYH